MPKRITIKRTEHWEWTAYGYGEEGTGSSEVSAERNLLRKVVKNLKKELKKIKEEMACWE